MKNGHDKWNGNANGNGQKHHIKLRNDVPLPGKSVYPFAAMKPGQSFHIPKKVSLSSVRTSATMFAKRRGNKMKFAVRKEDTQDGFGCWRVK